jgi:hypothetical protein
MIRCKWALNKGQFNGLDKISQTSLTKTTQASKTKDAEDKAQKLLRHIIAALPAFEKHYEDLNSFLDNNNNTRTNDQSIEDFDRLDGDVPKDKL